MFGLMSSPRMCDRGTATDPDVLAEAAGLVRAGKLVAFPTETVYGLAADATNPRAIDRLNEAKGRPPGKPYTLHLHSVSQLREMISEVPPQAARLMERFWPGPLTIVLSDTSVRRDPLAHDPQAKDRTPSRSPSSLVRVVDACKGWRGGTQTIGVRIPDHPVARAFLAACNVPVAAPSANRAGASPPVDAQQVLAGLAGACDYLLDDGPTRLRHESTVVEVSDGRVTVLREGAISHEAIMAVAGS